MTAANVVRIASMTTVITGACALQLVESGNLSLADDFPDVLPELGHLEFRYACH